MDSFKKFAADSPIAFSSIATVLLWICYIVVGVAATVLSTTTEGQQAASALGRFATAMLIVGALGRLGWLGSAGITKLGDWRSWLIVLPMLAYEILAHLRAFFGSISLEFPQSSLAWAVASSGAAAGLVEEITYRALVLYVLMRVWGGTSGGILKCALVSSFFFGAAHVIHLALGRPTPLVLLLVASASLSGIYYAAFTLRSGSVWPAVVLHVALNAVVGVQAVSHPGFAESAPGWLMVIALQVPAVVFGFWLLGGVPPRIVEPDPRRNPEPREDPAGSP